MYIVYLLFMRIHIFLTKYKVLHYTFGMPKKKNMYKIGEIAEKTGVTVNAVRHYVHEGLLPAPHKTSPNMAYYDEECIPLIIEIKKLQEEYFLPLPVIKKGLEMRKQGIELSIEDSTFAPMNKILNAKGMSEDEFCARFSITRHKLKEYTKKGLFAPQMIHDKLVYTPDDALMVEIWRELEGAGFTEQDIDEISKDVKHISDNMFKLIKSTTHQCAPTSKPGQVKKMVSLTAKFMNHMYINYSRENIIKMIKDKK